MNFVQNNDKVVSERTRTEGIKMLRKKKHAFTLAEVLLALVIVGIIAGLVLPSLLKDMQAKSRMGILKSTLVGIDDLIHKEIAQKRSEDIINLDIYNNPQLFLNKFNNAVSGTAFASSYQNYAGSEVTVNVPANSILLQNGVGIGIINQEDERCSDIIIDVTGEKSPNTVGIDYFVAKFFWDEDLTKGIHVGDVHGYITLGADGNESVGSYKTLCLNGDPAACFRLVELKGYDPDYLDAN